MQQLWKLKQAFVKEIIKELPEPKPPYNTVSSIIRILETKGMVGHETFGKTHRYFPKVGRVEYSQKVLRKMVSEYFDGSYAQVMSFIIKDSKLTDDDITELKELIKQKENE